MFAWLEERLPIIRACKRYVQEYHIPKNLNLWYCFGVLALVIIVNQFLSGFWLTMFYTPTTADAFNSIEILMRDVRFGWLFRYLHSTGASAFFIVLYLHVFRGLLYGSYQRPRELVWLLGMLLLSLSYLEAFFGYLLPWGQMSYWGAQVVTSFLNIIPYVGDFLVTWLRGDFVVSQVTLQRFYALHVIAIPFIIIILSCLHLVALHSVGSNNPDGVDIDLYRGPTGKPLDAIPFYPVQMLKDFLVVLFFLICFFGIVFFAPDFGGYFLEPANFITANHLITPEQIRPIWYMAPFYAILRAIPNQVIGVCITMSAFGVLFFLPWLDKSPVKSMRYKGFFSKFAIVGLIFSFCFLGYLGVHELTPMRQLLARISLFFYFTYFLFMPIYTKIERCKSVPARII